MESNHRLNVQSVASYRLDDRAMAASAGVAPVFSALTGRRLHDFDLEAYWRDVEELHPRLSSWKRM